VDRKILIVTNDPVMQNLLVRALSGNGYRSYTTPDGGGTLLQIGLTQPDLVILDVPWPGRERWRTLRRIREQSSVPLIALVAVEDQEGGSESLDRGADAFLTKPFDLQELGARVRALLRRTEYAARSGRHSSTVPIYGGHAC
jgi:DNA-binding response OmpR family regulator